MNISFLLKTELFRNIGREEAKQLLKCLDGFEKSYQSGEFIYHAGDMVKAIGLVLRGSVHMILDDVWGNQSILGNAGPGQVFAEAYACTPGTPLMVNVRAAEDAEILFLHTEKALFTCSIPCACHSRLIRNLLKVMASKNLALSHKISHTAPKSIRGRLLAYLSDQALRQNSDRFEIPFNRQQLADYLGVDRSALSNELGKMQKDGLLEYNRNRFLLKDISL